MPWAAANPPRKEKTMTVNEAKMLIAKEFISKYLEWLSDLNNDEMSENEFGRKYGWGKTNQDGKIIHKNDTQASMIWFQSHIFSGRYVGNWENAGIEKGIVYELHRIGFFSYEYFTSSQARALGKTDFYYLNQNKAKEIYKAYKNGFFA